MQNSKPLQLFYGVDVIDGLQRLLNESIDCCITSPPYFGLRDYGITGQLGLEKTPEEYVEKMVAIFREVRRVLKKTGTCWVNMGDSYNAYNGNRGTASQYAGKRNSMEPSFPKGHGLMDKSLKPKDLIGVPWMLAFALRADGWFLRQDIIWNKPNPMPESVTDRCTKSHEYVFLLSKSTRYFFNHTAIREEAIYKQAAGQKKSPSGWDQGPGDHKGLKGRYRNSAPRGSFNGKREVMATTGQNAFRAIVAMRNKRSVWTVPTRPYAGAHFATFPKDLIIPMIEAGCPVGGGVLDPFSGSGTTGECAIKMGRRFIGIDLNEQYLDLATKRISEGPWAEK